MRVESNFYCINTLTLRLKYSRSHSSTVLYSHWNFLLLFQCEDCGEMLLTSFVFTLSKCFFTLPWSGKLSPYLLTPKVYSLFKKPSNSPFYQSKKWGDQIQPALYLRLVSFI